MPQEKVKISFVIPAKNEEKNIKPLYEEIKLVMAKVQKPFEIIFVDDGSEDKTFKVITDIIRKDKRVKVVQLYGNFGKSVALQTGFEYTQGDLIFTMDADLQDNPIEIPKFLKKIDEGYDLVSGWKKVRHDPKSKVIPSRILNFTTRILTGVKLHDINCGYKLYRKSVVRNLNIYGELYRFIPIFAAKQHFRVGEMVVSHRPRRSGISKYGLERNVKGFLDLITIVFLTGYIRRPGQFFGMLGLGSFFIGFLIGTYIAYLRLTTGSIQYRQPLLFLGILLMIVGIQLISTGLLGELIIFSNHKNDYSNLIKEKIGFIKNVKK
jgi:glycosyltransferase involved in cell wall biosynthesis